MDLSNKDHVSDSDLLQLIATHIEYYRNGETSFFTVVNGIAGYIASIRNTNPVLANKLDGLFLKLEEINALSLTEDGSISVTQHAELIENTLDEIIETIK